jgi:hypothetical protein
VGRVTTKYTGVRFVLCWSIGCVIAFVLCDVGFAAERPNIVVIMCDDVGIFVGARDNWGNQAAIYSSNIYIFAVGSFTFPRQKTATLGRRQEG